MKDFSIVIPVRGNIKGLMTTLNAFNIFTAQKDRLEVLLIADTNDPDLYEYNSLSFDYPFDIEVFAVARSDNFCRDYYNFGARQAIGHSILVFNDDAYIQTYGWDDIVMNKIEGKSVYLVDMLDSTHDQGQSFPRFPMISKVSVNALGFFFHPQVRMWPADRCIWELYKLAECIVECHEVKIQHDHKPVTDLSKERLWKIYQEDIDSGVFPVKIGADAKKLKGLK